MSDATESDVGTTPSGDGSADGDAYSGILTAFPYAFRASESRVFRSYAAISGLCTAGIVLLFAFAIVVLLGGTAGVPGGSFTFSRAFFLFLMLLVVAPLVAPVLFVARRHRRAGSDTRYDRRLALSGYGFLAALYLSLVITTPAELQEDPTGPVGVVAEFLYGLPTPAAAVPPVAAVVVMYLAQRQFR